MAKSFYTIIDEGRIEVNHNGDDAEFDLPSFYTDDNKPNLEDEEALLAWAREHHILHGLLHKGIQKDIIDIRAEARPADKKINGEMVKQSILTGYDEAQERVWDHKIVPTPRPGQNKNKAVNKAIEEERKKMIAAMTAAGLSEELIKETISKLS